MIGKSSATLDGLDNMNATLILAGWCWLIEVLQVKFPKNLFVQDHRFIKKVPRAILGCKSYLAVQATPVGIGTALMTRKDQLPGSRGNPFAAVRCHPRDKCARLKACGQLAGKFATAPAWSSCPLAGS